MGLDAACRDVAVFVFELHWARTGKSNSLESTSLAAGHRPTSQRNRAQPQLPTANHAGEPRVVACGHWGPTCGVACMNRAKGTLICGAREGPVQSGVVAQPHCACGRA